MLIRFLAICFLVTLASPLYATKGEITKLEKELISLAGKLRKEENKLADTAIQQVKLDQRITDARTQIDENKEEIDQILQSLIRLSRTPPEAVVVMPGEIRQTVQAAQLMTNLTTQLETKTAALGKLVKRLKQDELNLAETRERHQQQRKKLISSQKALKQQLATAKTSYQEANKKRFEEQTKQINRARKKSRNLSQLMDKLSKSKPKEEPKKSRKTVLFSKQKGKMKLPVAGKITSHFGEKQGVDQTSHGYTMASAAGSTVISPASGEVMFTGPFLDYDNIVILRYDKGYHLLLAGMGNIDISVGQKIYSGQPIGRLKSSSRPLAKLYLELRKNGKAIDPSPWFG
jgi:septal ring factor EnvC (AmiA/AmiB activator)